MRCDRSVRAQPERTRIWYPALLLALGVAFAPAPPVDLTRRDCETHYDGIIYCVEDGGDVHVVLIDLENPHIRFEMVMAEDVDSVDTDRRERIEEMVTRPPYQDQEVVVAINADYFGLAHGPEGLTVKNGQRLDGEGLENRNALWRSSLAISRLNRVSLGRKSAEELTDPHAYREHFYNAVGGAPLILSYGVVIPNLVACLLERFPLGACRRTIQTTAGLSEDGRWLYLAVGEGRDAEGFAHLLRDYGAFTAIKLDGGGSSQLWYNGQMHYDSDRPVANALFVFYGPVPRHAAYWQTQSSFFVAEPGQRVEITFEISNTGFLDWEPDLGYRLKNAQGWPVVGPAYARLPDSVPAGGSLRSGLTVVAPHTPGVYEVQWQLVRRAEPIGERLWFALVVLSAGHETGLSEQVQDYLQRHAPIDRQDEWPLVRRELERMLVRAIKTQLYTTLDDAGGWTETPIEAAARVWWLAQRLPFAW